MDSSGEIYFNEIQRPHAQTPQSQTSNTSSDQSQNPGLEKLEKITDKTHRPLVIASSNLSVFPTEVSIDLLKTSVKKTIFFSSHQIITIPNENIEDIALETSLVSATLRIKHSGGEDPLVIKGLNKTEARQAKKVIVGIMFLIKEGIKLGDLDPIKDLAKIISVGEASGL